MFCFQDNTSFLYYLYNFLSFSNFNISYFEILLLHINIIFYFLKKIILLGDYILIEGDGSKNLPLKAPKDNEPVIIKETNLVIGIMGFDSINKKIKDICHRPELVSKLLRKDLDEIIDYKDLVEIAQHENGLKKNVNCKYKVIINKVDKEENLELCKNIANLCKKSNIDVVFTSYR